MISSKIMPQLVDRMGAPDTGVETMPSAVLLRSLVDSSGASAKADRLHGVKSVKNDLVVR